MSLAFASVAAGAAVSVERVGGPPLPVSDIAVGTTVWIGTRGGGLFGWRGGQPLQHLDIGRGLPSAVVLQVQPMDDGTLLVGTAQGIVRVDPVARSPRTLVTAPAGRSTAGHDADLVRRSPRDGSVLVRLTPHDGVAAATQGDAGLWRVAGARLTRVLPQDTAGTIAAALDARGDCLDFAGVEPAKGAWRVWVHSECRGAAEVERRVVEGAAVRDVVGVAALARNPLTRRPVLVLVRPSPADSADRRHGLMELDENGALQPHCSRAEFDQPVTGLVADATRSGLVVAVRGRGLLRLGCEGAPVPVGGDAPALRWPNVLANDHQGRLWVGTDEGLFVLPPGDGAASHVIAPDAQTMAPEALPYALARSGEQVLVGAGSGVVEVQRTAAGWRSAARWPCAVESKAALCGPSAYGAAGEWLVALRSIGVLRLRDGQPRSRIDASSGLLSTQVLHIAADGDDGVWVGSGATPGDPQGGGLQWFPAHGDPLTIALHDRQLQPGAILPGPDRTVWVASRAGVLQADRQGRLRRLSAHRVEAVFRNARTGAVAAVGASVERWDGKRFVPVLFGIAAGFEREVDPLGHPIDVVIDNRGRWIVLYSSGRIVRLDAEQRFDELLAAPQGIPASTRRLLHLPASDSVLLGTGREGLFELKVEP